MVSIKKENAKKIAEYFSDKLKSLYVLKKDCETFIEWTKDPSKNPNKVTNEKILRDVALSTGDRKKQINELEDILKDTNMQIKELEPLFEIVKECL